jgi:hypothetical protein
MDSHYAHLGSGANQAPVAKHPRREFAAELERSRQEDDELLRQSLSYELAGGHCGECGEAIRAGVALDLNRGFGQCHSIYDI